MSSSATLKERLESLLQEKDAIASSLSDTTAKLKTEEASIATLKEQLQAISTEKDSLAAEHANTVTELDQVRTQVGEQQSRVSGLKSELEELRTENDRLNEQVIASSQTNSDSDAIALSKSELDAINSEKGALEHELTTVKSERDHLKTDLSTLTGDKASLEEQLSQIANQCNAQKTEYDQVTELNEQLKIENDRLSSQLIQHTERIAPSSAVSTFTASDQTSDWGSLQHTTFSHPHNGMSDEGLQSLTTEREKLAAERDLLANQLEENRQQVETLVNEKQELEEKLARSHDAAEVDDRLARIQLEMEVSCYEVFTSLYFISYITK